MNERAGRGFPSSGVKMGMNKRKEGDLLLLVSKQIWGNPSDIRNKLK